MLPATEIVMVSFDTLCEAMPSPFPQTPFIAKVKNGEVPAAKKENPVR